MQVRHVACAAVVALVAAGCGGNAPSSPSGPSALNGPVAVTGATVQGQVQSGTSLSGTTAATTGAAASGLTVTIVGTSISTTVSGLGQFVLTGVPAGSNQLTFTGPGVNATVSFAPVQGTETISIHVKISGNQAEVESEEHDNNGDLEINGILSDLTGSSSSFSFVVGTKTVHGDSQTSFFGDGNRADTFATLKNGARVEVKAAMMSGQIYAQRIHINGGNSGADDGNDNEGDGDDDNGNDHNGSGDAEVAGAIGGLSSTAGCPSISFTVSGTSVSTNSNTEFKGGACSTLKNGDKVKVEGTRSSGGILATEVKKQ